MTVRSCLNTPVGEAAGPGSADGGDEAVDEVLEVLLATGGRLGLGGRLGPLAQVGERVLAGEQSAAEVAVPAGVAGVPERVELAVLDERGGHEQRPGHRVHAADVG